MASSTLEVTYEASGKALIEALDDSGLRVRTALWAFSADLGRWELVLGTGLVDREGPLEAYKRVGKVLRSLPEKGRVRLDEVSIRGLRDPLVRGVHETRMFRDVSLEDPVRTGGLMWRGVYLDEALIYRI